MWIRIVGLLPWFVACVPLVSAQSVAPGDWPHFNRDPGSSRYSPLKQITVENVSSLQLAWSYPPAVQKPGKVKPVQAPITAKPGKKRVSAADSVMAEAMIQGNIPLNTGGVGLRAVPVVVGGVMYLPAGNQVVAVDASNGEEVWRHTLPDGVFASSYGVNYWPGTEDVAPRIFFTTNKRSLFALEAATGRPAAGFGKQGVVKMGVAWRGVPVVVGNTLAIGARVIETPQDPGAPGDTRAFDAVTGALNWVFHSVPGPAEVGHETWLDDGWRDRSGANVWGPHMTVDDQLGLLYFTLGSPSSNYYGGDRPGNNLFGNSIVAVDGDTGEYRWHFQTVHHDIWDYDNPPAPALVDIQQDGETIPALAQVGKTGLMFILDRRTGKPVFGVEERPVARGDVPGEWYSPTQPFPRKPVPLARMSFSQKDRVTAEDTTAEHAANCAALVKAYGGFYNAGPFTPFLFHKKGSPPPSTIIFPGNLGGTLWGGMATDQRRGYIFVYTQDLGSIGWTMEKEKKGGSYVGYGEERKSDLPYTRGSLEGQIQHSKFAASAGEGRRIYPCQKPPWGRLNAVDANTGEVVWQRPVGIAEDLPEGKRITGLPYGHAGPTATAGDLLFYAALSDAQLRAFNSVTGDELWSAKLRGAAITQPVTFLGSDGRQYVSITVAGIVKAFALPRE